MIVNKKYVGGRKGGSFSNSVKLFSTAPSLNSYILENPNVRFTFREDSKTGIYLYSFQHKQSSRIFYNKAKSLWKIGVRKRVAYNADRFEAYSDDVVLYPDKKYLTADSLATQTDSLGSFMVLEWENYPYDPSNLQKLCKVTLTVRLNTTSSHLDISAKIEANPLTLTEDMTSGSVLHTFCMPEISIVKDEDIWEEDVLVIGTLMGDCTRNPIKNLDSPRYTSESVNYKQYKQDTELNYKFYKGGQVGYPLVNTKIINLGSPGWMSIPLCVFGNRDEKSGFMYYAMDSDGLHAKNFQIYSNGKNIHLRAWDISDHEIVPYGVGGKHIEDNDYSTLNTIGWSLRIRPFKSPSKYVDWYGCLLYKQEAVAEQEDLGWIPSSFYDRYLAGQISAEEVEVPFYTSSNGHLTGTISDILNISWYQELYKSISNQDITPRLYNHVQEATLHSGPLPNQTGKYYGWVSWGTGMSGIDSYKSPNYEINEMFSGSMPQIAASGIITMLYSSQSMTVASGSHIIVGPDEANSRENFDIVQKRLEYSDKTFNSSDYDSWKEDFIARRSTNIAWKACNLLDITYDVFTGIAKTMSDHGAGVYRDTLGNWGSRGCYASSHTYVLNNGTTGHITHPRGWFTHYVNSKELNIVSGAYSQLLTGNSNLPNGVAKYSLAQSSEFLCDTQLKYVPMSIPYYLSSPVTLQVFVRTREDRRSDFISEIDASSLIYGFRKADKYRLCVPSYQIAFSDRSILGNWAAPTLSNALDLSGSYFNLQSISGYNSVGVIEINTPTHAEREQQLRNVMAVDFAYFNRLTVYHSAIDIAYDNPLLYSGITTESHSDTLTGAQWSGYFDYAKQLIRVQAYEPEYIYHGTPYFPLEDFSVTWTSGVYTMFGHRYVNPGFSEPTGWLEEAVVHSVRKHVSLNQFLVTLSNWSNITGTFSGIFDPSIYGINSNYAVYSLDVTGANAGTKQKITELSFDQNYEINQSINPKTTLVYEFKAATTARSEVTGLYLKTDYADVKYSYSPRTISINYITVPYSYESSCSTFIDPTEGFKAASTQAILNNLPQWMYMRQKNDSCGWQIVNAWGMALENVIENTSEILSNLFLETANLNQRFTISSISISPTNKDLNNLLFNSSFSIKDKAATKLPAGWTNYGKGQVELSSSNSILGNSVKLKSGVLSQTVILDQSLENVTASIFIKLPEANTSVKLIISAQKLDGTSISSESEINTRSLEWRKVSHSMSILDEVYSIKFTIVSTGDSWAYISAPKLELGSKSTSWSRNVFDIPYWVKSLSPFINLVQVSYNDKTNKKIPLIPVGSQEEFTSMVIPTRIEKHKEILSNTKLIIEDEYGRRINSSKEVEPTRWTVSENNDSITEYSSYPTLFNKYGNYTIKEIRYSIDGRVGIIDSCSTIVSYLCSAIREGILYVLCKEETDKYIIKLMKPHVPPNSNTYLESIEDFELNIQLNANVSSNQILETISNIGFSESDNTLLIVNTNIGRQIHYKLKFDYCYLDVSKSKLYMLEDYEGCKIQVI